MRSYASFSCRLQQALARLIFGVENTPREFRTKPAAEGAFGGRSIRGYEDGHAA